MTKKSQSMTVKNRPAAAGVLDQLRARRVARAEERRVRRELEAYTSATQIKDLLAALEGHDGPQADGMRNILMRNLNRTRLAS